MSSYQNFTDWFTDTVVFLFKAIILFIIFRCGLILLDINIFVPVLDPFLVWVVHSLFGVYPQI